MMKDTAPSPSATWRRVVLLLGFSVLALVLVARAVHLQVIDHAFYKSQGEARQLRTMTMPAHRGDMFDRHGEPLAISTPIDSLWGVPERLALQTQQLKQVAESLSIDPDRLVKRVEQAAKRNSRFVYVKRHVPPSLVDTVMAMELDGLSVQREYRRFYPNGPAAAHVIGFTGIDDTGSEGLEMAYDDWLSGKPGVRRIVIDGQRRVIKDTEVVRPAAMGRDLTLSIDRKLQYFTDRALREAVEKHNAESGSVVVMDTRNGAVRAIANYPNYNPNDISDRSGGRQRNRALTDVFEPGSTMKPFTIAAALESGEFRAEDVVYTSPGYYRVGRFEVRDLKDYGLLDLTGVLTYSSNVGMSKIAGQLDAEQMWSVLDGFGFGHLTGSEFPGEVPGYFDHHSVWHRYKQASISFGYGISVTALQLVRAYTAIANGGVMPVASLIADNSNDEYNGERVIDAHVASQITAMLQSVVEKGSGQRAQIAGYTVAGKTGTAHRSEFGGYAEDRYASLFAGFAPATDPRLAIVVVIHDPTAGEHFGGAVAAPVFADVMGHGLRLEGIGADAIEHMAPSRTMLDMNVLPSLAIENAQPAVGDQS